MSEIPEREIPEDIMQTVGKALGPPDVRVNRGIYAATCLRVSWALMAEREACASIAQKVYDDWWASKLLVEPPTAEHAASAIRFGVRP